MNKSKEPYIEDVALAETFADSIEHIIFDGGNLRIEFSAYRYSASEEGPATRARLPVNRLVLSLGTASLLANKLQQTLSDLESKGVIKRSSGDDSSGGRLLS